MYIITDHRIKSSSLSSLKAFGLELILMPSSPLLQDGVSAHTDMLIFIGFGRLFCHESYYRENKDIIEQIASVADLKIIASNEIMSSDYPHDVLFNAVIVGNSLICNKKSVSRLILEAADERGYTIINVSQGYAKCSICVISDNAIITADKSIAHACESNLIDVLLIEPGHIDLPPYSYGFIGGASGACGENVYFCGSIDHHPDAERIKEFCKKHNKTVISLSDDELQDVGSLFFI